MESLFVKYLSRDWSYRNIKSITPPVIRRILVPYLNALRHLVLNWYLLSGWNDPKCHMGLI